MRKQQHLGIYTIYCLDRWNISDRIISTIDYVNILAKGDNFKLTNSNSFFFILLSDSPYHDVSGLPDPYMDHQMDVGSHPDDAKSLAPAQQHMSLGYDETLESGYSTPNSRNRRVIREIIV